MMFIDKGLGGEIYYGGLLMVLFGSYSFFKLQFKHAVISGGIITLFYVVSSLLDKKMNSILLINNYFFILGANFMGMPVAYTLESYLRRNYQGSVLLKKAMRRVRKMSVFDELTNIANRRYFNLRFPEEFNRMRRLQYPLSLIIVDIDFFKEYNDQFGHQAGDECLVKIVGVLKQCVRRASDLLTRWGGEEFVVILGGTSLDSAYIIAEKIRQGVLDLRLPRIASGLYNAVTVSIGISSLIPSVSNSCKVLFKAADTALYRAKESGRNRVEKESCS
ncbi:MAG: diguanylate cyclase [Candidatus Omnitrophota bacterium]